MSEIYRLLGYLTILCGDYVSLNLMIMLAYRDLVGWREDAIIANFVALLHTSRAVEEDQNRNISAAISLVDIRTGYTYVRAECLGN